MFDGGSPGDGQHDGGAAEEPGYRYLHGAGVVSLRDFVEYVAGDFACSQREPGNEDDSIAVAIIHHVVPFAVGKAIAVLHANDTGDSAAPHDVLQPDVRPPDPATLAL